MLIKHGHWKYNIAKPVLSYKMHIDIYPLLEPTKHIKKRAFVFTHVCWCSALKFINISDILFELVN